MKRKFFSHLILISMVVLLLAFALLSAVYRGAFERQTRTDLEEFARLAAVACDGGWDASALQVIESELRITLIDNEGAVLFDSKTTELLQNHGDRPEVIAAIEAGEGYAQRTSATLGYDTYYYALRLNNGLILRIAMQTDTIYAAYNNALPMLAIIFAGVLAVALLLSGILTRSLVGPIEKMAENLDHIRESVPYPELKNFAENIKSQQDARDEAAGPR